MPSDRHFDDLDWNAGELDGTDWILGREKGYYPPEI